MIREQHSRFNVYMGDGVWGKVGEVSIWHFLFATSKRKVLLSSNHFPQKLPDIGYKKLVKEMSKTLLPHTYKIKYFTICSKFWQLLRRRASPQRNLVPWRDMLPLGWRKGGEFSWPTSPRCHSPHRSAGLLCCCKPCRWLRSHLRCSLPWRTDYLTADMLWNYPQTEQQKRGVKTCLVGNIWYMTKGGVCAD